MRWLTHRQQQTVTYSPAKEKKKGQLKRLSEVCRAVHGTPHPSSTTSRLGVQYVVCTLQLLREAIARDTWRFRPSAEKIAGRPGKMFYFELILRI